MSDNFISSKENSDVIDLGKIFRYILMQSKLVLSIVFVFFCLAYANYSFSTKQYLIKSLLHYESVNQNVFDPTKSLQLSSGASKSDISNLVTLYESRTNMLKVIEDLKLNINISYLNQNDYLDIDIFSNEKNNYIPHELRFLIYDKKFTLLNDDLTEFKTADYGDTIEYNELSVSIKSTNIKNTEPIEVNYIHPAKMYSSLKSKIVVDTNTTRNSFFSKEGLITVSYISDNIELGKRIINYANNIFLKQRIYEETEKSRKAISFIDKNIKSLESVLETNKLRLKEFREKNKSLDVSLETQAIIQRTQILDESLSKMDVEITKAKEIYTPNNPIYLNLLNEKEFIKKQKNRILDEIEMMPKEQQEYIDLFNNLEITRALFEELESRRLAFSILEASTIGDIRIIDEAYVIGMVSPQISSIFIQTFLAFIVACFFAIVRGIYFMPISNPAEIFDNNINIPVIGVVPQVKEISFKEDDIRLNTSIESLIVNITSIMNDQNNKKIITITSPSPFNGKSTLSKKISEGFAKIGKKVLLLDNDLKRGKLAKSYNVKSISKKTFDSIDESTIENFNLAEDFYLIPRIKDLTNSFQFLYSESYKEKINFLKNYFDYIIVDTGPILSVSDSSILIEQSDLNILVVRHGINRINEIKQVIDNFKQINQKIDGIIYNGYEKPKSYYGYYGVYGNYSYQYYAEKYLDNTYEYETKD